MNHRLKHLLAIASMPVMAFLAYWQVALNKYILTHDFVNCWLPWRYYLSQCIQNGVFPFWNPYQQLGYPIHADLQGPTWYLESWLFSMLSEQNPVNLQYLFVAYIGLAGIGMYGLSFYLQRSIKVAWCIGLAYMLGGFFVSHSQHFYSIISAAWLPFILLNFLRLVQLKKLKYGIYTAVFLFFTLTGGNHTFAFFTAYLLVIISIIYLYQSYKVSLASFWQLLKHLFITLFFTIAQIIMVIIVYVQVKVYVGRLEGLDYESCIGFPFTWEALVSFCQPFATTIDWEYYKTDPSMSNHYFGWFLLPFCLVFVSKRKLILEWILACFAIFCLIMSFGDATPLYKLMYNFLPGVNLFRFVSYFAFMFTFCMLLLAGNTFSYLLQNPQQNRKLIINVFSISLSILFLILLAAIAHGGFFQYIKYFTNSEIFESTKYGSRYNHIAFQALIQLILMLILAFVFWKKSKWIVHCFMLVLAIDMLIAVQFNICNVAVSKESPIALAQYLSTLPKDFPCPADEPIQNFSEQRGQKGGLFRNTATFHKWVSDSYHNSFVFSGKTYLNFEKPKFYEALLNNRLFYFSNALYPSKSINQDLISENLNLKVFVNEQAIVALSEQIKISDLPLQAKISLKKVSPNRLESEVFCNENAMLHCLQSYYPGWKAYIDGQQTEIYKSNGLTMSIVVPKGAHKIWFIYNNTLVLWAGIAGYTVFLCLMIYITFINRKHLVYRSLLFCFWLFCGFTLVKYFYF